MDFGFDARTLDLRKQLLTFMDERVYPAEAVYTEQVEEAEARGQLWERMPVTAELKAEARSRGLWNLFLTGKAAQNTLDRVIGSFHTEPLGEFALKGLQQKLPVFAVLGGVERSTTSPQTLQATRI